MEIGRLGLVALFITTMNNAPRIFRLNKVLLSHNKPLIRKVEFKRCPHCMIMTQNGNCQNYKLVDYIKSKFSFNKLKKISETVYGQKSRICCNRKWQWCVPVL